MALTGKRVKDSVQIGSPESRRPLCKYFWLRGGDLNPRPLGYEPNELPDCSTPRHGIVRIVRDVPTVPAFEPANASHGPTNSNVPNASM